MTPSQLKGLYFPAWNAAFKANWRMHDGAVMAHRKPANPYAEEIEAVAKSIFKNEAVITQDHLRKACHAAAISKICSSKSLTNPELDRVVALFKLLEDPEDLKANIQWENPAAVNTDRLIVGIAKLMSEPYIAAVSNNRFGTRNWKSLNSVQLRQLLFTIKARSKANADKRKPKTPF